MRSEVAGVVVARAESESAAACTVVVAPLRLPRHIPSLHPRLSRT